MQLVLWFIYFGLVVLAQLAVIPSITGHQYFVILMGVVLIAAFFSTLFLPMKKIRRTTVMWLAFSILLALRGTLVLTWMWRTSTPITEFNNFVISWFGLHDAESVIRFFINPRIIQHQFDAVVSTIEHMGYFHSTVDGVVMLAHHIGGLIVEVTKIAFPVLAIIGAIINKSKMPKIEKPEPKVAIQDSQGRVLDDKQIEEQRQREEKELQRKLEEMRRLKEAEQQEEAKRNEKQQQDDSQRRKFDELSNLALSGNAKAQHELALMYLTGLYPAEKDIPKAVGLLEESAGQGNVSSQIELGRHYNGSENNQLDKAILWYEKAANGGDAEAQYLLGDLYCTAKNTELRLPNYRQAAYWWGKAVESNHLESMRKLSSLFQLDKSTIDANSSESFKADPKLGVELAKKLVYTHNDPESMLDLGVMFFRGQNVEKDEHKGVELIEKGLSRLGDNVPDLYLSEIGLCLIVYGGQSASYDRVQNGVKQLEKLFANHPKRAAIFTEDYLSLVKEILDLGKKTLSDMDAVIKRQKEESDRQSRIAKLKEELYWAVENVKSSQEYLKQREREIHQEGGNFLTLQRDYYYTEASKKLQERMSEVLNINSQLKSLGVDTGF